MTPDDDPARPTMHGRDVSRPAVYAAARSPSEPTRSRTEGSVLDKDDRSWQIGTDDDVEWISQGTVTGLTVTSAIPRIFEAYATVVVPEFGGTLDEHERRVVRLLADHGTDHVWWLGYLDTGASDIVFPDVTRVRLYSDWAYVLVKAGPGQALRWRAEPSPLHCRLPDLMFPTDRTWLISALWDDDWWCLGGSAALIETFLREPEMEARQVSAYRDATPPGHVAR